MYWKLVFVCLTPTVGKRRRAVYCMVLWLSHLFAVEGSHANRPSMCAIRQAHDRVSNLLRTTYRSYWTHFTQPCTTSVQVRVAAIGLVECFLQPQSVVCPQMKPLLQAHWKMVPDMVRSCKCGVCLSVASSVTIGTYFNTTSSSCLF